MELLVEGVGDCVKHVLTRNRMKRLMTRASGNWYLQEPGAQHARMVTKTSLMDMVNAHMEGRDIDIVVLNKTFLVGSRSRQRWSVIGWKTWCDDLETWVHHFTNNHSYFVKHLPYIAKPTLAELAAKLDIYGTQTPIKDLLLEQKC